MDVRDLLRAFFEDYDELPVITETGPSSIAPVVIGEHNRRAYAGVAEDLFFSGVPLLSALAFSDIST